MNSFNRARSSTSRCTPSIQVLRQALHHSFKRSLLVLVCFHLQSGQSLIPIMVCLIFAFLDNWIFTAFLPHLAIIALIIVLLIRKKFLSAAFIYLLACALYSRGGIYFHLSAFMLCSIAASSFLVYEFLVAFFEIWNNRPTKRSLLFYKLAVDHYQLLLFVSSMFVWLNYRQVEFWFQRRSDLSYESQFGSINQ